MWLGHFDLELQSILIVREKIKWKILYCSFTNIIFMNVRLKET